MNSPRESTSESIEASNGALSLDSADADPGTIVWHREDLRLADNPALAAAVAAETGATDDNEVGDQDRDQPDNFDEDGEHSARILPLFIFDPAFYDDRGMACDARIQFLHESLRDLDRQYRDVGGPGLTYVHGDPIESLDRFAEAGWNITATDGPTGRYGLRRDDRARKRLGVQFIDGDGLVRNTERPRRNWKESIESWLAADPHDWDPRSVTIERFDTGVKPQTITAAYGVESTKSNVPNGGRSVGRERLASFVARIGDYPGNISSPVDARDGTSGLSPYLGFGCLSIREVHR